MELYILVFSKGGKYNSSDSIQGFKATVAYCGIKVEKASFRDSENKIFKLEFSKLEKLPSQSKGKQCQEQDSVIDDDDFFEEPSKEERGMEYTDYFTDCLWNVFKIVFRNVFRNINDQTELTF